MTRRRFGNRLPWLCAADGQGALVIARGNRPDLILLDIAVPGMDGIAVLKELENDLRLRDVPVILLTAITDKEYISQAREVHACDYLLKSQFSIVELMTRVESTAYSRPW